MNHSFEIGEINQLSGIVAQPGWDVLVNAFVERHHEENRLERITGDAFGDGQLKGRVDALKEVVRLFGSIKQLVEQLEEKEKGKE